MCRNRGDDRLEGALLESPAPAHELARKAVERGIKAAAEATFRLGLSEREYRARLDELASKTVGDIGELAVRKILAKLKHTIIDQSSARSAHRLSNDLVSIDDSGALLVHDVKATVSGKQNKRVSADGRRNLPKARTSSGRGDRQLSDPYNRVRLEESILFETGYEDGAGPKSLITRIDLVLMQYQTWEVDPAGLVGRSVDGPWPASEEITEAIVEVLGLGTAS